MENETRDTQYDNYYSPYGTVMIRWYYRNETQLTRNNSATCHVVCIVLKSRFKMFKNKKNRTTDNT